MTRASSLRREPDRGNKGSRVRDNQKTADESGAVLVCLELGPLHKRGVLLLGHGRASILRDDLSVLSDDDQSGDALDAELLA